MTQTMPLSPPMGKPVEDPFASERLVFRPADRPEYDKFFDIMLQDGYMLSMADPSITQMYSVDKIKKLRNDFSERFIGAVVCLKPSDYDQLASDRYDKDFNEKNKPFPIGYVSVFKSGQKFETAEIGLSMTEGHRAHGYGTETIEWALNWSFTLGGLHRVQIANFEYNNVAYALYKKLGFVEEGFERECLFHNGRRWGVHRFAMLKHEWEERQAKKEPSRKDEHELGTRVDNVA